MTAAGTGPMLELASLSVRLPAGERETVHAVKDVTLEVRRGERVGIVGESGSGKSVTARAIAGLLPTSPRVRVDGSLRFEGTEMIGAPARAWREIRSRRVGMVFQDPLTYLNPTKRIGSQVAESVRTSGRVRDRAGIHTEVLRSLVLAGLDDAETIATRFPHELSGGMRQRVLIAIAVAKRPDLLIADEPTTALDATVQAVVLRGLDETVRTIGTSLLLVSHDLAVVAQMTDRLYVMYGGRVLESGPTRSVLDEPRHPYTKALLRAVRSLTDDDTELYSIPPELRDWLATDTTVFHHEPEAVGSR